MSYHAKERRMYANVHYHHHPGFDFGRFMRAMAGRHGGHGYRHHDPRGGNAWWARGGFPFGGPPLRGGPKARRGDVRTAALLLLAEEPRNGYQIMQEIEQRSDGTWRPSPGSIYPALQQLEDEGLIRAEEVDGRKRFHLTDAGRAAVAERDPGEPAPWETMSGGVSDEAQELGQLAREVGIAFIQVMTAGSDAQHEEARKILIRTRRDLYRVLAEDPIEDEPA